MTYAEAVKAFPIDGGVRLLGSHRFAGEVGSVWAIDPSGHDGAVISVIIPADGSKPKALTLARPSDVERIKPAT